MPDTQFNLAETRGKHTRAGREAYVTQMQGNSLVDGYNRHARTDGELGGADPQRMYVRRGRKAYLEGRR